MSVNMFLKLEEPAIYGSSTAPGHAGEIEVLSWSQGFAQPTDPSHGSSIGGDHQNLSFSKYPDSASDELMKCNWSGKQIGHATLTCYRSDSGVEYLTVIMKHVIISKFGLSGGPGDTPVENVTLDYGIIDYNYKDRKPNDENRQQ